MNSKENSSDNEKCKGCKHITDNLMGFCYMFSGKPDILPCAQHDKYKEQRKETGRKIYNRVMGGKS